MIIHEVSITCPECLQISVYGLVVEALPNELPCLARNNNCTHTFTTEEIVDAYAHSVDNS